MEGEGVGCESAVQAGKRPTCTPHLHPTRSSLRVPSTRCVELSCTFASSLGIRSSGCALTKLWDALDRPAVYVWFVTAMQAPYL